jgi:GNAT superfamily N-acetyltransferase
MTSRVRSARPQDVPVIQQLVHELAVYEREPDAVQSGADELHGALFGEHPQVFCHVAQAQPVAEQDPATEVVGFALWYVTYSTWTSRHGIWLEDLFVRPAHRDDGLGQELMVALAGICVERGYSRLEWWVLDWNSSAHGFYRRLGASPQEAWTVWRLDDTDVSRLAAPTAANGQMAESAPSDRDGSSPRQPARGRHSDDDDVA